MNRLRSSSSSSSSLSLSLSLSLSYMVWMFTMAAVLGIIMVGAIRTAAKEKESPQYKVVHSESEFEIRFYGDSAWMSAPVSDLSFRTATYNGFHRLFQYIQGANLNSSRIAMTVPVLTSIVPGAGPLHSSAYFVRLYLPVKFQATPPVPLPELDLIPDSWSSHCVVVRKFSGFARDDNIVKEAEKLASSLDRSPWANSTSSASGYSIVQYNSPFKIIRRTNEVWVDVSGSEADGCKSTPVASY